MRIAWRVGRHWRVGEFIGMDHAPALGNPAIRCMLVADPHSWSIVALVLGLDEYVCGPALKDPEREATRRIRKLPKMRGGSYGEAAAV